MKVSSVELGKKKMGFFRVGGLREIELRGLEVDYYESVDEKKWARPIQGVLEIHPVVY
jgi:hypothetical protein